MKKLRFILISILLYLFPFMVYAKGSITVSTNSLNITKGTSSSFTINASNAAGKVDLSVSNGNISISTASTWIENESITVSVTGNTVGSSQIVVRLTDAATFDEEELSGSYTINVNVTNPETPKVNPTPNPIPSTDPVKSNNTKLFSLEVEKYTLIKEDDTHFSLTVPNNVEKVNIKAKAEDTKAKVTGDGEKTLKNGENSFEIVVTAENGSKKTYNVKITRKAYLAYADLKNALQDKNTKEINVRMIEAVKLTKDDMAGIKNSKKIVNFEFVDAKENPLYMWIIDGSQLTNDNEFDTKVIFESENAEDIGQITNYADGVHVVFAHEGDLPVGTRFKVYVGNVYKGDNTSLHIYNFNKSSNEMTPFIDRVDVQGGYVEYDLSTTSEQFLTRATIASSPVTVESSLTQTIVIVVAVIEFLTIIILLIYYFVVIKQKIKDTEYVYGDGQL